MLSLPRGLEARGSALGTATLPAKKNLRHGFTRGSRADGPRGCPGTWRPLGRAQTPKRFRGGETPRSPQVPPVRKGSERRGSREHVASRVSFARCVGGSRQARGGARGAAAGRSPSSLGPRCRAEPLGARAAPGAPRSPTCPGTALARVFWLLLGSFCAVSAGRRQLVPGAVPLRLQGGRLPPGIAQPRCLKCDGGGTRGCASAWQRRQRSSRRGSAGPRVPGPACCSGRGSEPRSRRVSFGRVRNRV